MIEKIKRFIHAVKVTIAIYRHGYWWDYTGLLTVMEMQLQYMVDNWSECMQMYPDNKLKDMKIALNLIKRIVNDDYECAPWRYKEVIMFDETFKLNMNSEHQRREDLKYLCNLLNDKLFHWWD